MGDRFNPAGRGLGELARVEIEAIVLRAREQVVAMIHGSPDEHAAGLDELERILSGDCDA